nr:PDF receptor-like [Maniola hyperantus]
MAKPKERVLSVNTKQDIAKQTRILDICGCIISAIAIMISMIVYRAIPALRHQRTTIHLFLFGAMLTNIIVQLLLYADQVIVNGFDESLLGGMEVYRGINNTQYVCEAFYFVQEYSMSTIFMWILIDAVFISRCFSSNTVRFTFPLIRYAALSCLLPLLNVAIWAALTGYFFERETKVDCDMRALSVMVLVMVVICMLHVVCVLMLIVRMDERKF